jgi:ketosteroid isomerase-like protein
VKPEHPNLTLARALWSAIAEGDAEALALLLAEDVTWRMVGMNPLSGSYHGPDEVVDYLARVGETADEFASQLDSIFVNDDGAVIALHVSATRDGKSLEMDYLTRLRVQGGVVVETLMVPVDPRRNDEFWS